MTENPEDAGTLAYLADTARQAGLATTLIDIEDLGLRETAASSISTKARSSSPSSSIPGNGCCEKLSAPS